MNTVYVIIYSILDVLCVAKVWRHQKYSSYPCLPIPLPLQSHPGAPVFSIPIPVPTQQIKVTIRHSTIPSIFLSFIILPSFLFRNWWLISTFIHNLQLSIHYSIRNLHVFFIHLLSSILIIPSHQIMRTIHNNPYLSTTNIVYPPLTLYSISTTFLIRLPLSLSNYHLHNCAYLHRELHKHAYI